MVYNNDNIDDIYKLMLDKKYKIDAMTKKCFVGIVQ